MARLPVVGLALSCFFTDHQKYLTTHFNEAKASCAGNCLNNFLLLRVASKQGFAHVTATERPLIAHVPSGCMLYFPVCRNIQIDHFLWDQMNSWSCPECPLIFERPDTSSILLSHSVPPSMVFLLGSSHDLLWVIASPPVRLDSPNG